MSSISAIRRTASDELGLALRELFQITQSLSVGDVRRRFARVGSYDAGWKVVLPQSGAEVFILKPSDYPEKIIDIYTPNKTLIGNIPNIESTGRLCLAPPHTQHYLVNHISVSISRLYKADRLLLRSPQDVPEDEWTREIQAYWILESKDPYLITSLISPTGPSRALHVSFTNNNVYVADDADVIATWQRRRQLRSRIHISLGALLWLDRPLAKSEIPNTYNDLIKIAPEARALLDQLPKGVNDKSAVLIGFYYANQPVLLGLLLEPYLIQKGPNQRWPANQASKQFRLTGEISQKIYRSVVQRADANWLFFRGGRAISHNAAYQHVAILGCGSLGSGVAEVLVKSGVGHITLVDPEALSYDNVARHSLGARWVGHNKAIALKGHLEQLIPHISVSAINKPWSSIANSLSDFDVVISTMAIWQENLLLNRLSILDSIRPIIYAWLEPHALAAHAICIRAMTPCLECGFTEGGQPMLNATKWTAITTSNLAGCAANFQPYGALDILSVHQLTAELALDVLSQRVTTTVRRSWVGDNRRLLELGGSWSESWQAEVGELDCSNRRFEIDWKKDYKCRACSTSP